MNSLSLWKGVAALMAAEAMNFLSRLLIVAGHSKSITVRLSPLSRAVTRSMGGQGSKPAKPAPVEQQQEPAANEAAAPAPAPAPDYTKLPKVELHLHLDGACRVETLRDLAQEYQLPYPTDDLEEFKKVVCLTSPQPSLEEFLKVFTALEDILRTREAIERVTFEYCEDLKKQNCLYFECRYNPISSTLSPENYIEGAIAGLERGERDLGVKSKHILAFKREEPGNVSRIVELALKYKDRGVVAVDIAGNECLSLDPKHVTGFREAKENGLHVTAHAGESGSGSASNVKQAIEEFGAERIGHGYHVLDDEEIYQLAKERKVHFEACPTSSVFTNSQSLDNHAIKRWAADGVSFSLSTDDPGVMLCDLQGEYVKASRDLQLTKEQLVQSVRDGASAAFLSDEEKQALQQQIDQAIAEWESAN